MDSSSTANHAITTPKNINHFSHCHELELLSMAVVQCQQQGLTTIPPKSLCSCCRFRPYGQIYICRPCDNFFLHLSCSKFPHVITHPAHGNHTLTLLPVSAYPGGVFGCDACKRHGDGFNYHCSSCKFDLHPICAHKPSNLIIHQFHSCPLKLLFKDPYYTSNSRFLCDICRDSIESNEWRYRCNACDFDVHLRCATASPVQRMVHGGKASHLVQVQTNMNSVVKGGGQNNGGVSCSNQQKQMGGGGGGGGAAAAAVQSQRSKALADAAVRGLVQGGAQQVARMAVQGLIGDTGNPNGDVDGINILELVGDLFLNWTI